MKVFFSETDTIPLPANHHFPAEKYRLLKEDLLSGHILSKEELHKSIPASRDKILLAHTPDYIDAFIKGTIELNIMSRVGLPWSETLVKKTLSSVGGTIRAAQEALNNGISGNLAGGTHHALSDRGMGFCIFNDVAITVLDLLKRNAIQNALIIDLDAHQGNGTADILSPHPEIYTFSMHGAKTFPAQKSPSTLDIGLPEMTADDDYLSLLNQALPKIFATKPDIVFYLAGTDPLRGDRFGKLALSMQGLEIRDRLVLQTCYANNIPLALVMAGGYSNPIKNTVQAHLQTYRVLKSIYHI